MPHPPQAKKRHRQALRHEERNRPRRTAARTAVRRARELIDAGKQEEAAVAVRQAGVILDRAARRRILHPNNAARRKSRLMRHFNAGARGEAPPPAKRRTRAKSKTTRSKKS